MLAVKQLRKMLNGSKNNPDAIHFILVLFFFFPSKCNLEESIPFQIQDVVQGTPTTPTTVCS